VIAEILGASPEQYIALKLALDGHYGTAQINDIEVLGALINEMKIDDFQFPPEVTEIKGFLKTFLVFLKVHLTTQPSINSEQCEKCNNCIEACPMKCIALCKGRLVVNSKGCIQCLCCMEVCPNGAIDLREGLLLKLLKHFKIFE